MSSHSVNAARFWNIASHLLFGMGVTLFLTEAHAESSHMLSENPVSQKASRGFSWIRQQQKQSSTLFRSLLHQRFFSSPFDPTVEPTLIRFAGDRRIGSSTSRNRNPFSEPWHLGREGMATRLFFKAQNPLSRKPVEPMRILLSRNATRSPATNWIDEFEAKRHPKGLLPPLLFQRERNPTLRESQQGSLFSCES